MTKVNQKAVGTKSNQTIITKVKAEKKPSVIEHSNIIKTVGGCKQFLHQYKNLPLSCKKKIEKFVDLLNNNDLHFRISQYPRESERGYTFYELTKYSARENVKPTREHIPAIEFITKLIDTYYNSNEVINIDINKLISHCESRIVKPNIRTRKVSPKANKTLIKEETNN